MSRRITIRVVDETAPFSALADAKKIALALRKANVGKVKVDGVADTSNVLLSMMPNLEHAKVSIFTGPPKERPKSTLELRAKSCAEELNSALYDLARSCGRDDLAFEASALEHEAKALYNRILRLQSHRKWLADRGLAR